LTVLQSMFGNIEAEGFSLETFFDQIGRWYLIADNKAVSWVLHNGEVTYILPTLGETDGVVVITMRSAGTESIIINDESIIADKFTLTMNIKSEITELI